ncbi:hypothetical protein F4814DRAFT_223547 [Daldinia grandis]|nr:hypothetical protein F4814DRAFT_223547 [Daldinia grandis]
MWESLSGEEHSGLWWVSSVGHSWSSSSLRSLGGGVSARLVMPRWSVDGVLIFPFFPLLLCTFLCAFLCAFLLTFLSYLSILPSFLLSMFLFYLPVFPSFFLFSFAFLFYFFSHPLPFSLTISLLSPLSSLLSPLSSLLSPLSPPFLLPFSSSFLLFSLIFSSLFHVPPFLLFPFSFFPFSFLSSFFFLFSSIFLSCSSITTSLCLPNDYHFHFNPHIHSPSLLSIPTNHPASFSLLHRFLSFPLPPPPTPPYTYPYQPKKNKLYSLNKLGGKTLPLGAGNKGRAKR